MTRVDSPPARPTGPLHAVGASTLGALGYLGGLVTLVAGAAAELVRPRAGEPSIRGSAVRHAEWMIGMGAPLAALLHVGLGSFLSMQAFFGATFIEAAGPVVAIGLLRNVAPLMTGFLVSGLFAARITPELRLATEADRSIRPARRAASRILGALLAGPVLVLVSTAVGVGVGSVVAAAMLGLPAPLFFAKALEMLWVRDVWGVVAKGMAFSAVAASLACHEGLRPDADASPAAVRVSAYRAACLSSVSILMMNNAWFLLVYHAGPAFGPTVLLTPGR